MEIRRRIGAIFFISLLLLTGLTSTIKGEKVKPHSDFGPLEDGQFFVVYTNVRNYDAYGYLFDEKGEVINKAFLGQGFTNTGDLSAYKDGLFLVNPEQNEDIQITKEGVVEKATMEEKSLLEKERRFTFVSGAYRINIPDNIGLYLGDNSEPPTVNADLQVFVEKEGEKKDLEVQGKWIDAAFIYDEHLYLVMAKAGYDFPAYVEKYDLKEGILVESHPIELEGIKSLSSARFFVRGDQLVIADETAVVAYNLKDNKMMGRWEIPEGNTFKRLEATADGFYVFTATSETDDTTGALYQVGMDGTLLKTTSLKTAGSEKYVYELSDAFVSDSKIYAFYAGAKEAEAQKNDLEDLFYFLGTVFGIYNGPVDNQCVYVYELETGLLIQKIKLNMDDSRLQNGTMLPWVIEESEATNLW